jgi:hypothetical protein
MDHLPPFMPLECRRVITAEWLPADLRDFYAAFEGVGRESEADRPLRLCRLDELSPVAMHDLHLFDGFPLDGGWDTFRGVRIGNGIFFDEIVYVTHAPVCPPGSIMAFGVDVDGPGGVGSDDDPPGSLVLAWGLGEWLERLREDGWEEFALVPGEVERLPVGRATRLRQRLAELNPRSAWAQDS